MNEEDQLLTLKQAAQRLGVSVMTVRRYIEADRLKYERPGREYLIWQSELERFNATRRKPGRPPKS